MQCFSEWFSACQRNLFSFLPPGHPPVQSMDPAPSQTRSKSGSPEQSRFPSHLQKYPAVAETGKLILESLQIGPRNRTWLQPFTPVSIKPVCHGADEERVLAQGIPFHLLYQIGVQANSGLRGCCPTHWGKGNRIGLLPTYTLACAVQDYLDKGPWASKSKTRI